MRIHSQSRKGQALVMMTVSLISMFGIMGLAVDVGWSHFIRRSAQKAADAAALAALHRGLAASGYAGTLTCGQNITCQETVAPCPAVGNLASACSYAQANGFTHGGESGRQSVTVHAGGAGVPPTAPGVNTHYWVTVRVATAIPQLFSAIQGNSRATVAARATAGVVDTIFLGSLVGLNRQNDQSPIGTGVDMELSGSPTVVTPGGIFLSSTRTNAGIAGGSATVQTPFTYIRGSGGSGGINLSGSATWQNGYINRSDGPAFRDPFEHRGQPPLTTNVLTMRPVPNGLITDAVCPGGICAPGNYYAVTGCPSACVATGDPIRTDSDLTFSNGGNFGDYVFFGGLHVGRDNITLGPGRYVLAGVNNPSTPVLDTDNRSFLAGGSASDPGRVIIMTNSTYPGLDVQVNAIPIPRQWTTLGFGNANFKAGNNDGSGFALYGIDRNNPGLPSGSNSEGFELADFSPVAVWWDQRNSNVRYNSDGTVDISCGSIDSPCTNTYQARTLELAANQRTYVRGVVYQPRGTHTIVQGSPGYRGPLQLLTGSVSVQGSGVITIQSPTLPITTRAAALVE